MTTYNTDYNIFPPGPIKTNNKDIMNECTYKTCDLECYYNDTYLYLSKNKNGNLEITFDRTHYLTYNEDAYKLKYITFSKNSSHKYDNKQTDLELYIVHNKCENIDCDSDKRLILHILISNSNDINQNIFFNNFKDKNKLEVNKNKFNPFDILPYSKKFYEYGDDNTIHIVFENIIYLNSKLIQNLNDNITLESSDIEVYDKYINYNNNSYIKNNKKEFIITNYIDLRKEYVNKYKENPILFNSYGKHRRINNFISIFKYFILIYIFIVLIIKLNIIENLGINNILKSLNNLSLDIYKYIFISVIIIVIFIILYTNNIFSIIKGEYEDTKVYIDEETDELLKVYDQVAELIDESSFLLDDNNIQEITDIYKSTNYECSDCCKYNRVCWWPGSPPRCSIDCP